MGCRACERPCALMCLDGCPINCVLCEKVTKRRGKNHKGKQRLRKQCGRCRSLLLPGIVRTTDDVCVCGGGGRQEGGGPSWGKVRPLLNGFTNGRKPLSLSRWRNRALLLLPASSAICQCPSATNWPCLGSYVALQSKTRTALDNAHMKGLPIVLWFPGCLHSTVSDKVWTGAMLWLHNSQSEPKSWCLLQR